MYKRLLIFRTSSEAKPSKLGTMKDTLRSYANLSNRFLSLNAEMSRIFQTKAHDRRTRNSYEKLAPKTRTRNLHEIEHSLFDVRNSCEKYLAASRYDTRTSFSRELTRTNFSYEFLVCLSWALVSAVLHAVISLSS